MDENNFKVIIPAQLEKSSNGEWKIAGLASTESVDRQGERIIQKGLDLTPVDQKRGILNWDHLSGPENTIGVLDGYKHTDKGLYIEGRLFQHHAKAKSIYGIMKSLEGENRPIMGLSVEGKVLERDPLNPKIIRKCRISAVALTMSPVNTDTQVDLAKSMNAADVEFDAQETVADPSKPAQEATFTASQVVSMLEKALSISMGNAAAPADRTGGDALGKEEMDKKPKKMKKLSKDLSKSMMLEVLEKLQVLYPNNSRSEIWTAVQDRLQQRFPELKSEK